MLEECLAEAELAPEAIDATAVTTRPGLLGSLLIGATAAKALAWSWQRPLIDVHHIEAHAYAALMSLPSWQETGRVEPSPKLVVPVL